MSALPDQLRALADRIESRTCTGVAASWCPLHGDCTCPRNEWGEPIGEYGFALDSDDCPLHSRTSSHAEASLR